MHELSEDLVGFWKTQTIFAAIKLGLIDELPGTLQNIATATKLNKQNCLRLLRGLWELNIVTVLPNKHWTLTAKGELLKPTVSSSMAAAAEVWANSHYVQWQSLATALQRDLLPQTSYFTALAQNKTLLNTYQSALSGYALSDYKSVLALDVWQNHRCILDAGGGNGILLSLLLKAYQHLEGILLELPEVVAQIPKEKALFDRIQYKEGDFFEPWHVKADAIILSRVLHDWPDDLAVKLLNQARCALLPGGKIYILEMILDQDSPKGGVLDLNMFVMTGGCERTLEDWQRLLAEAKLSLSKITELSSIVSVLVVEEITMLVA